MVYIHIYGNLNVAGSLLHAVTATELFTEG